MDVAAWQIALIVIIAFFYSTQKYGFQLIALMSVLPAWAVGLILGDPATGLAIGATMQLMSLGVAALAGASVPDYPIAAIVGTAISIISGQDESVGLAVGIAVGMLCVQLDVIAKILNGFLARRAERLSEQGNYRAMNATILICPFLFGLVGAIPTFVVLIFGEGAVNFILDVMPAWFTTGLSIAGGMLPVVGMAMLLTFMPVKKFISFVAIGFVLSAYLNLGVLPIAILGAAAAYEHYKTLNKPAAASASVALEDE